MANQDKLTLVANAFEHWRHSRTHRYEKTPQDLRQQTVGLLAHYSRAKITSTLKISGTQFKQWHEGFSSSTDNNASFVTLAPVTILPASLNLTLDFTNGNQLRLSGDISAELLTALTRGVQA